MEKLGFRTYIGKKSGLSRLNRDSWTVCELNYADLFITIGDTFCGWG